MATGCTYIKWGCLICGLIFLIGGLNYTEIQFTKFLPLSQKETVEKGLPKAADPAGHGGKKETVVETVPQTFHPKSRKEAKMEKGLPQSFLPRSQKAEIEKQPQSFLPESRMESRMEKLPQLSYPGGQKEPEKKGRPPQAFPPRSQREAEMEKQPQASHPRSKKEKKIKRLPQALGIGVRKCGTGALARFLSLNKKVAMSATEVHYFDRDQNFRKGLEWYRGRMRKSYSDQVTMEKTPRYSFHPGAEKKIHEMNPNIKLIFMVCSPLKRLVSDYVREKALQKEKRKTFWSFYDFAFNKDGEVDISFEPVRKGIYAHDLKRFYKYFPKSQILIVDGDAFVKNPVPELNKIETFLGLKSEISDKDFMFSEKKGFLCLNNSGNAKCMSRSKGGRPHPNIPMQQVKKIIDFYQPYNEELYKLINRSFDWTKPIYKMRA